MKKFNLIIALLLPVIFYAQTTSYGVNAGTAGTYNSFFGTGAGQYTTGDSNTFLGYGSGGYFLQSGNYNVMVGTRAGQDLVTGDNNVFLGYEAGSDAGSNNIYLGTRAGIFTSGSNNVFIGYQTGKQGSNMLIINNGSSNTALIYGEFDNRIVTIDGNLGIGTTNVSEKLTVNGKILCEEVEVILDVPAADYVFEKYYNGYSNLKADYVMPTLEEVENYTKANHHLPEVPSATALKEDGLQLKEMSMILLQKIEELTLYTIEQEKRIKTLEAQIAK
jgi:hypothetical protein